MNDSMTFYNEYVLEESNAADYFNTHVMGFSFESRDDNSTGDLESINATVWYSFKVGRIDRTRYEVYTFMKFIPYRSHDVMSAILFLSVKLLGFPYRYVNRIMRCVNLTSYPIWLQPMLSNANRPKAMKRWPCWCSKARSCGS